MLVLLINQHLLDKSMSSNDRSEELNEINLKGLFILLWAFKFLIFFTCGIGVLIGGYLAFTVDRKYTSTATFKLGISNPGPSLGGNVNLLANIAGLNLDGRLPEIVSDEYLKGRIFIEKIDTKLDLKNDLYFNSYSQKNNKDPFWKSEIKRLLNYQDINENPEEAIWQGIVSTYSNNIIIDISQQNIVKIQVTHTNPIRASDIANVIMDTIITNEKFEKENTTNKITLYLTEKLANSLNDLEIAQSKLKKFAMENSALPLNDFAEGSLQLDELREKFNRTSELYDAAFAVDLILQKKSGDENDYLYLKKKFPIVQQIEFRRVLGQSETSTSWNWPEKSTIRAVVDTLLERKKRLQGEIEYSQKDAVRSAKALEIYGKLKREEKINEASYTVLIEQVKAHSMSSDYRTDNSKVYEYAAPSRFPSEPDKIVYISLGLLIGFLLGTFLSFGISWSNGVYYSKYLLTEDIKPNFVANAKFLNSLRKQNLFNLKDKILKKEIPILRNLAVEINKDSSKFIIISSSKVKIKSHDLARIISIYLQRDDIKIAIINFSCKKQYDNNKDKVDTFGPYRLNEQEGGISILAPNNNKIAIDFLSHKNFSKDLKLLEKSFDLIFVCADDTDSISLVRALQVHDIYHIMLVRVKHTKQKILSQIRLVKPIQGLLYV